jgi:hypothetical protein
MAFNFLLFNAAFVNGIYHNLHVQRFPMFNYSYVQCFHCSMPKQRQKATNFPLHEVNAELC